MGGDEGYFQHPRPEMMAFIPERRARVLEVGCASGDFLMGVAGVEERWGIEPSGAAEVARGRLDRVFHSTFEGAEGELPLGYFDVVVCNDVIEHMPDHDVFLGKIGRYLVPGGVIVGSIPNVRFYRNLFELLVEKDWHYTDSGILDRTHTRFFTEKSWRKSLGRHGFLVDRFEGLRNAGVPRSGRGLVYYLMARAAILGSLGYFSDIQFLQFGFRARAGGTAAVSG